MEAVVGPAATRDAVRIRIAAFALLTCGYAALLVLASGLPLIRDIERAGGGSATGWDKVLHLAAFFILGLLLSQLLYDVQRSPRARWALAGSLLVGTAYASLHEGSQAFIPGFVFNPLDWLADIVGLAIGATTGAAGRWGLVRLSPPRATPR